jgi:hypothetical protein
MDRAEAEAIYDAGREPCVRFILELAARVEALEERLRRLEERARQDSRTSSKPPSQDPPETRQQRRAEARAKAKELLARDRVKRKAGGQDGHRGAGRELSLRIRSMRSSSTTRGCAEGAATSSPPMNVGPLAASVVIRSRSCRRSA